MSETQKPKGKTHTAASKTGTTVKHVAQKGRHTHVVEDPDDVLREQIGGFTNFLREYAVVGLAVGFIVGQQANVVVRQIVASFIEPLLQALFGTDLGKRAWVVHHDHSKITFAWGEFVYVFIEFLFVAVTIYLVVKLLKLDKLKKKEG